MGINVFFGQDDGRNKNCEERLEDKIEGIGLKINENKEKKTNGLEN